MIVDWNDLAIAVAVAAMVITGAVTARGCWRDQDAASVARVTACLSAGNKPSECKDLR
jgi:hypothetical protein